MLKYFIYLNYHNKIKIRVFWHYTVIQLISNNYINFKSTEKHYEILNNKYVFLRNYQNKT